MKNVCAFNRQQMLIECSDLHWSASSLSLSLIFSQDEFWRCFPNFPGLLSLSPPPFSFEFHSTHSPTFHFWRVHFLRVLSYTDKKTWIPETHKNMIPADKKVNWNVNESKRRRRKKIKKVGIPSFLTDSLPSPRSSLSLIPVFFLSLSMHEKKSFNFVW